MTTANHGRSLSQIFRIYRDSAHQRAMSAFCSLSRSILKPRAFQRVKPLLINPLPKSLVTGQPKPGPRLQTHQIRPFSGTRQSSQAALPLGSRKGIKISEMASVSSNSGADACLFPLGCVIGYILSKSWWGQDETRQDDTRGEETRKDETRQEETRQEETSHREWRYKMNKIGYDIGRSLSRSSRRPNGWQWRWDPL
jgi:hypothetical protein